jgi:hypothetical protein
MLVEELNHNSEMSKRNRGNMHRVRCKDKPSGALPQRHFRYKTYEGH